MSSGDALEATVPLINTWPESDRVQPMGGHIGSHQQARAAVQTAAVSRTNSVQTTRPDSEGV